MVGRYRQFGANFDKKSRARLASPYPFAIDQRSRCSRRAARLTAFSDDGKPPKRSFRISVEVLKSSHASFALPVLASEAHFALS